MPAPGENAGQGRSPNASGIGRVGNIGAGPKLEGNIPGAVKSISEHTPGRIRHLFGTSVGEIRRPSMLGFKRLRATCWPSSMMTSWFRRRAAEFDVGFEQRKVGQRMRILTEQTFSPPV